MTVKGITVKALQEMPVIIPPLPEQQRIVAKVDQLMAQCDELEERLTQSANNSQRLTEAVIHHLTAA